MFAILRKKVLDQPESHEALLADGTFAEKAQPKTSKSIHAALITLNVLVIISALAIGFFVGRFSCSEIAQPPYPGAVPQVSIGSISQVFTQHPEFMHPPPAGSIAEPAWDSLLPKGLGYVKNPHVAATENVSTIAAFHQLHCLYTLRRIYYSSAAGEQNLEAFDNGVDRHSHVAHCFEYLRQALMCCADPSLEPFEPPEGGFPGMGFERQCRDYDGLKAWAEEWRTMEVKSFILDDLSHNRSIGGRLR